MPRPLVLLRLAAVLCLGGSFVLAATPVPRSPIEVPLQGGLTAQQIEAEWLHCDALRASSPQSGGQPTPEEDAAGAVDGQKTGKWGFHTLSEDRPWWQVDLGQPTPLERIVLYNRCDSGGAMAPRAARFLLLVSDDGEHFSQIHQHDGSVFLGQSDGKPLLVPLAGVTARFLRLQLPGHDYFHLDEVEIYAAGKEENVALGRPATQSSVSQWSERHASPVKPGPSHYATELAIQRGRRLAEALAELGVDVAPAQAALDGFQARWKSLADDAADDARRELYFEVRRCVRGLALRNPLLDFDRILFVKRAPPMFPHMSDQYYGWWQRPGGAICLLEGFRGDRPQVRTLTAGWPDGTFLRPDLSYDGRRILFAWCRHDPELAGMEKHDKSRLPEDCFFHLFEMDLEGGQVRQLTQGKYDDFDARYLPSGEIVFVSTRKGQFPQMRADCTARTTEADLVDSYVRCGGGNTRPVAVYTLHKMDAQGKNLRPISAFENFEWNPTVAADGRILYARWDYIDRFNGPYMSLWSTNPDGTNAQLVYGNYTTRPQCVFEPRAVPGSSKIVFTAAAHHSNEGGSLVLLDRTRGIEEERPLVRLTPEVCFPETEGWPSHYYLNPCPLSEEFFLTAWSDRPLPAHTYIPPGDPRNPCNSTGIYLYDAFGNLEPLFRDPAISCMTPLPVRPRPAPPALPETTAWQGPQEAQFLLQDVYAGLDGVNRGAVKRLRVVAVPPKVQPQMNSPVLGVSAEDPGKFVLGTVPVESDGSAYFRIPSGVPVFFQALDAEGFGLQTMRSLTYVQAGQTLSCIGCHEHRDRAPATESPLPLAARREASRLTLGPEGSWPLAFDRLIQPMLQRDCASCHQPGSSDARAAAFDLTPAKAYGSLMAYAGDDLKKLAFERPRSVAGDMPARQSKLLTLLRAPEGHAGVKLSAEDLARWTTWMDVYAQRQGHFSDAQAAELDALRTTWAHLLAP